MGSRSEDSSTRPLQTCREGLQGARSRQGLGLCGHFSLLHALDPSGGRASKGLVLRLLGHLHCLPSCGRPSRGLRLATYG
eukprot:8829459-Alexandrium_andersonii.AAC.1